MRTDITAKWSAMKPEISILDEARPPWWWYNQTAPNPKRTIQSTDHANVDFQFAGGVSHVQRLKGKNGLSLLSHRGRQHAIYASIPKKRIARSHLLASSMIKTFIAASSTSDMLYPPLANGRDKRPEGRSPEGSA